ncbi:MAG: hypothetical protein WD904_04295 [Dehalococcoidia bacterium]
MRFRRLLLMVFVICLTAGVWACGSGDDDGGETNAPTGTESAAPGAAYILYRDASGNIIASNLATAETFRQPVDFESEVVISAMCSPDSKRVALLKQRFTVTNRELVILGEDAPDEEIPLSAAVQGMDWSPDGTHLVYTEYDGFENIHKVGILDIAAGEATELGAADNLAGSPSWSPDGSTIAYNVQDAIGNFSDVLLLDASGGEPQKLQIGSGGLWYDPEWTPDGESLLVSGISEGESQLYLVSADGGEPAAITNSDIFKRSPEYSPDGAQIAYTGSIVIQTVSLNALHSFGIFLMNSDGSDERALTADPRLNPGAAVDPYLDAFLLGWCLPGPWLDDSWEPVAALPTP